jgi:hypothetical protein
MRTFIKNVLHNQNTGTKSLDESLDEKPRVHRALLCLLRVAWHPGQVIRSRHASRQASAASGGDSGVHMPAELPTAAVGLSGTGYAT